MSCFENADLNEIICCCSGQASAIFLSFLFFLNGGTLAGSLIWQHFQEKEAHPEAAHYYLVFLIVPASFIITSVGLCALLGCHKKITMFICMLWPPIVSALPVWFIIKTFHIYYESKLWAHAGTVISLNVVVFMLPICSILTLLLSIDCLLLLCCLACCARSEGGADLFDLEAASRDESTEEEHENATSWAIR